MLRSILIALVFLSYSMLSYAMQPISVEGTSASSAYFNSNIEVISEDINIDVSEHFREARYTVQYEIHNKQAGTQIPLVFALYNDENNNEDLENIVALNISIDGNPVAVQNISSSQAKIDFDTFFKSYQIKPYDYKMYLVEEGVNLFPDYVRFIEEELSVGYHTIVASYNAMPSYRDTSQLTYEYNYDYSFDPIRLKQGFANTTIRLNFDGPIENVSFQIFPDSKQDLTSIKEGAFTFKEDLPESIDFGYQRQFPAWVRVLVRGPAVGFFMLFCVLAARWHISEIKRTSDLKFSSIIGYMLIASVFIPFVSIFAYTLYECLAYSVIKAVIIDDMSKVFGTLAYVVLFLLLAPFYSLFIYYKYYRSDTKS